MGRDWGKVYFERSSAARFVRTAVVGTAAQQYCCSLLGVTHQTRGFKVNQQGAVSGVIQKSSLRGGCLVVLGSQPYE